MEAAGAIPGRLYGVTDRYLGDVLLELTAGYAAFRFVGNEQWFRLLNWTKSAGAGKRYR